MANRISAREVDDIKTMTSLDTSVVLASLSATATAAPPSPPSRLPPSALSAPRNSPPSKRKLDTEDELARKRLQVDLHSSPEYTAARGGSKSIPQEQEDHESENRYHESYDSPACKRLQAEASLLPNQLIASDLPKSSPKEREHPELDNRYLESEERPPDISPQATRAPLSRQNLKLLQQEVATSEEMDNESTSSARKRRAPSRQASNSDLVSGTSGRTRESIPSHSFYRYHTLDHANVQIWAEPPSTALQTQLDIIINANVDDERTREISVIAKQKSTRFSKLLRGSHREDDLVELVYEALLALHEYEMFTCPRKAGKRLR